MIGTPVYGDLEAALRRFKRQVEKDGFLSTYRRRAEGALSRTERRKQKDQAAALRRKQREKRKRLREDEGLTKMVVYRTLRDKSAGRSTLPNAGGKRWEANNAGGRKVAGGSETLNKLTDNRRTFQESGFRDRRGADVSGGAGNRTGLSRG